MKPEEPSFKKEPEVDSSKTARQIQWLEPPKVLPERVPAKIVVTTFVLVSLAIAYAGGIQNMLLVYGVIVGLSAIIMMHEGAHFLVAKLSGMKCTEFFVGFGPRLWSFQRGETEYGIKAIPAGGYVRIIGMTNLEEVDPADEARSYRAQGYFKRMATTIAGIVSHFIFALVVIYMSLITIGTVDSQLGLTINDIPKVEGHTTPAEKAGLKVGDQVVSLNDYKPKDWDDFAAYLRVRPGKDIDVVVRRNNKLIHKTVTPIHYSNLIKDSLAPGQRLDKEFENRGYIGVGPKITYSRQGVDESVAKSFKIVGNGTVAIVRALGDVFSPKGLNEVRKQITNDPTANNQYRLSSPVGITKTAGDAIHSGFRDTLSLIITINLSLGIFNLVPLLPLDGGHVAIATYEAIVERFKGRKHRVDIRKIAPVAYAVVAFMVVLTLTSLYLDIARPPGNPFE